LKALWYRWWHPWIFLIPTLIGLFVFRIGPIAFAFFMSFTDWNIMSHPRWVGLANYRELFQSDYFKEILANTFEFSAIYVSGVMVSGLILALLVNRKLRGVRIFRTMYFTPVVTSAVAVGIVWSWMLSPRYGIFNFVLEKLLGFEPPSWLGDEIWALPTVAFVQVWKMAGYYMIIFLAGLQHIPKHLYEAAKIDGASPWQSFWKITLPLLSPTTFFAFTIAIIDSFRNFEIIYTMTQGGPQYATTTLVYSVYVNAFVFYRMGYASAVAFVLLAIVAFLTWLNFLLKKHWVEYQY